MNDNVSKPIPDTGYFFPDLQQLYNDTKTKIQYGENNTSKELLMEKVNNAFIKAMHDLDPLLLQALDKTIHIGSSSGKLKLDREFSHKEIRQISKKYQSLRNKQIISQGKFDRVCSELRAAKDEQTIEMLMAKISYQEEVTEGDIFETRIGNYRAEKIIDHEGLRAIYFVPLKEDTYETDDKRCPILAFRGTERKQWKNLLDDLNSTIGKRSFEKNKDRLGALISNAPSPPGIAIVGHSLGGALAQLTAAEFVNTGKIARVSHYNAPGVGLSVKRKYDKGVQELVRKEKTAPEIHNIYDYRDIVRHFGGVHLPTTTRRIIHGDEKTSRAASHTIDSLCSLFSKAKAYANQEISLEGRLVKIGSEGLRLSFGQGIDLGIRIRIKAKAVFSLIRRTFGDYRGHQIDLINAIAKQQPPSPGLRDRASPN